MSLETGIGSGDRGEMEDSHKAVTRKHAYVSGIVQGVGFRWFCQHAANSKKLGGWVRNLPDGSVELEVEGPEDEVNRFLDEIHSGPLGSRVDEVRVIDEPLQGSEDFIIRFDYL